MVACSGFKQHYYAKPCCGPLKHYHTYTLTATNAAGCPAWATVKVTVNNELKIPNSITPNGDGVNDTWVIKNLENYPKANVQIFTRAGILVYSARGLQKIGTLPTMVKNCLQLFIIT